LSPIKTFFPCKRFAWGKNDVKNQSLKVFNSIHPCDVQLYLDPLLQHALEQQGAPLGPPFVQDSHKLPERNTMYGGKSTPEAEPHTIMVVDDLE